MEILNKSLIEIKKEEEAKFKEQEETKVRKSEVSLIRIMNFLLESEDNFGRKEERSQNWSSNSQHPSHA